jgi:phosphohistidine swiveling domain-containing protein
MPLGVLDHMSKISTIVTPLPVPIENIVNRYSREILDTINITSLMIEIIALSESIYYGVDNDEVVNRSVKIAKDHTAHLEDKGNIAVIEAIFVEAILHSAITMLSIMTENNCITNYKNILDINLKDPLVIIEVFDYL